MTVWAVRGGILALDAVGDDHHVGKVAPVALVLLGEDDEAVEGMDILGVTLVHEPVGHAPEALAAILDALEAGEMDLQHLLAPVLDLRKEAGVVAEHGHGDVGLFLHQELGQPPAVKPFLDRERECFDEEILAVRGLVVDAEVHLADGRVHGEGRCLAALVRGGDDDVIAVPDQPVGLVRQHFFHAGRPVCPGDEVEEFHGNNVSRTCRMNDIMT